MIRALHRRLVALRDREEGVALAAAVGAAAVLMILVTVMLASATSGTMRTRSDSDFNEAVAAAYAGLADYQSKLAADNSYQQYGNIAATFSTGSTFTALPDLSKPANKAFTVAKGGDWKPVLDSAGKDTTGEAYRWEVNNVSYYSSGVVKLRVTGRSGKITRTLVADLKGTGFINYLYFTDYEVSDPTLSKSTCTPQHLTDPGYKAATDCARIQFASSDHLGGPVRTNDEFTICGATFDRSVESTAADGAYVKPASCGTPVFNPVINNGTTKRVQSIALPATNANLAQETRYDLTGSTVPFPGCLYTGPTSIVFNSDGTMTVRSPWTLKTQITGDPPSGGQSPAMCGTPGWASSNTLGSPGGQKITVPDSNLIYVQAVQGTSGDPNYWASGKYPTNFSCVGADGSTAGNGVGFPVQGEDTSIIKVSTPYGCQAGDAFVSGTFKGAATVGAANYLYVTDDLTYSNPKSDLLGLVGQKAVWVSNPFICNSSKVTAGCSSKPLRGYTSNFEIDAAIASNNGTFTVQNYDQGSKSMGTLTVVGSIAQLYRGPVATSSSGAVVTGYAKNYGYDPRLQFKAPPKFLKPVSTTYGITTQVEVKPAYLYDGTPKYTSAGTPIP